MTSPPAAFTVRRFLELADANPEKPAIETPGGLLSRGQLAGRITQISESLLRLNLTWPLLGIFCPRDTDLVAAFLAAHYIGGAYLPLDANYPDYRLAQIIANAKPELVITTREFSQRLPAHTTRLILDDLTVIGRAPARSNDLRRNKGLAYVTYTSGSSGQPKGVAIPLNAMQSFFRALDAALGDSGDQVWLSVSSIMFDSSVAEILWPVTAGHLLCIGDNTPNGLLNSPLAHGTREGRRITHIQCAPSVARLLAMDESCRHGLAKLTTLLLGGEPYPAELVTMLRASGTGPRLLNVYGPTETTVWVAHEEVSQDSARPVPIGKASPGTELYVCDSNFRQVAEGGTGVLLIAGDQLASGYWLNNQLTVAAFLPNPFGTNGSRIYYSGDLAVRGKDGVVITGRVDDQIKVRGNRVEIGEVESHLLGWAAIRNAVVLADQYDTKDTRLVCVYDGDPPDFACREYLHRRLPSYMVPTRYIRRSPLPMNIAGKIDRSRLRSELALSNVRSDETNWWPPLQPIVVTNSDEVLAFWSQHLQLPSGWRKVYGPADIDACKEFVTRSQANSP